VGAGTTMTALLVGGHIVPFFAAGFWDIYWNQLLKISSVMKQLPGLHKTSKNKTTVYSIKIEKLLLRRL
jgi:hypothetical protein